MTCTTAGIAKLAVLMSREPRTVREACQHDAMLDYPEATVRGWIRKLQLANLVAPAGHRSKNPGTPGQLAVIWRWK